MPELPTTIMDLTDEQLVKEEKDLREARDRAADLIASLGANHDELLDEAFRRRFGLKPGDIVESTSSDMEGPFVNYSASVRSVEGRLSPAYIPPVWIHVPSKRKGKNVKPLERLLVHWKKKKETQS